MSGVPVREVMVRVKVEGPAGDEEMEFLAQQVQAHVSAAIGGVLDGPPPDPTGLDRAVGWAWAFIHNVLAHPLLALTLDCSAARWFHDWTAEQAWPDGDEPDGGEGW